jgi:hypothetical protein
MTVLGKLEEYVSQLENAVGQLRQENEQLKQALQQKSAPTIKEADDEC